MIKTVILVVSTIVSASESTFDYELIERTTMHETMELCKEAETNIVNNFIHSNATTDENNTALITTCKEVIIKSN